MSDLGHLFAEHNSRYDVRCTRCGVSTLDPKAKEPCSKPYIDPIEAINKACAIIERGDLRLLASDGPAGGQPPELSLAEWRDLYATLDAARQQ